jgi:hypothetical protein
MFLHAHTKFQPSSSIFKEMAGGGPLKSRNYKKNVKYKNMENNS